MSIKPSVWLTLACLALVALAFNYYPCQLDDAFITYRYAAHVAEHGTLAYNLGEAPVEGFSSPLWLALLALCAVCFGKASLPNAAFALGVAFAIGACLIVHRFCARLQADESDDGRNATYAGLTGATLLVLCPAVSYYAAMGLEPMAFLCLVLLSLAALCGALPAWAGWTAALALPWARPEAAALPVVWIAMYAFERTPVRWSRLLRSLAVFAISAGVLLVVRYGLFDDLLPNTYYAKLPDRMRGVSYVGELLATPWVWALVCLGLLGAVHGGRTHKGLFLSAALFFLVALAEGGDWMPLGRFVIPAFGVLTVAASGTFARHRTSSASALSSRTTLRNAAFGVLAFVVLFSSYGHATKQLSMMHSARRTLDHEYAWLSSWLRKTQARSIALMDIGKVGFENEVAIIDLAGLTDRTLARMAGHHLRKRIDPSYIVQKRPDLIVVRIEKPPFSRPGALDANAAMTQIEGDLLASAEMAKHYVVALMILPGAPRDPYYGKIVFARHDFAVPAQLMPTQPIFSLEPLPD